MSMGFRFAITLIFFSLAVMIFFSPRVLDYYDTTRREAVIKEIFQGAALKELPVECGMNLVQVRIALRDDLNIGEVKPIAGRDSLIMLTYWGRDSASVIAFYFVKQYNIFKLGGATLVWEGDEVGQTVLDCSTQQ